MLIFELYSFLLNDSVQEIQPMSDHFILGLGRACTSQQLNREVNDVVILRVIQLLGKY